MASDKPTPAQVRYLVAAHHRHIATMGAIGMSVCRACKHRGWLSDGITLTRAGRAIAERAISEGVEG